MADYMTTGDSKDREEDVRELASAAKDEQMSDSKNGTYVDGETEFEPHDTKEPESYEQTEGDNTTSKDQKEEWKDDVSDSLEENEKQADEQEGAGAFAAARKSWANGWGV